MKPRTILFAIILAALAGVLIASPEEVRPSAWDGEQVVAHEWGTFTELQGSNGVILDGLIHEERDLPEFVYDLRTCAAITGVSPKMETPVIYFYSPVERRMLATVHFPKGVITQWYPAASGVNHQGLTANGGVEVAPPVAQTPTAGEEIDELVDGWIEWGRRGDLTVLAPEAPTEFPEVAADDPWRFARQVTANPLRICNLNAARHAGQKGVIFEPERFLFYRGLGDFRMPVTGRVREEHVEKDRYRVDLELTPTRPIEHLFIVWVGDGQSGFQYVPRIDGPRNFDEVELELAPIAESTEHLVAVMATHLTETGLYADEALAMARTWQHGYFQDPGLRLLYVLPRDVVDRELPLEITDYGPVDGDGERYESVTVVRTFVGRLELLSPERERRFQAAVEAFAQGEAWGAQEIERWGRFGIPYLERVRQLTDKPEVIARIDALMEAQRLRR